MSDFQNLHLRLQTTLTLKSEDTRGEFVGEGFDEIRLDTLFLVMIYCVQKETLLL